MYGGAAESEVLLNIRFQIIIHGNAEITEYDFYENRIAIFSIQKIPQIALEDSIFLVFDYA